MSKKHVKLKVPRQKVHHTFQEVIHLDVLHHSYEDERQFFRMAQDTELGTEESYGNERARQT